MTASPDTVLASAVRPAAPGPGLRRRVRYVVMPHPDDEFESWSLVGHSPDHYTVFVLLTRGEASSLCSGIGIIDRVKGEDQTVFGERLPRPQPFSGRLTPSCPRQRVNSWHAFLDLMAKNDPSLDKPRFVGHFLGQVRRGDAVPKFVDHGVVRQTRDYDLYVGARSARIVFDLGDGRLTPQKVTWAVQTARRLRQKFPVTAEDDVIGSAYYNATHPDYVLYTHPDHLAVQLALYNTDQGTPGPQWGRTVPNDPNRRRRAYVDNKTYCEVMCVGPMPIDPFRNPTAQRQGAYQEVYGWLAFAGPPGGRQANAYWPSSFEPTESIFSQAQDFWHRFGDFGRSHLRAARRGARSGGGLPLWPLAGGVFVPVVLGAGARRSLRHKKA